MQKTKENNDTNFEIQDYIGRKEFVDKIINTINFANDKKSWTFAIDGAWGSGKSFVLNMIEKELKDNQVYLIVKYDAWKNDFYNEPLIAILYNIVDALVKTQALKQVKEEIEKTIRILSETLNFIPYAKKVKENIKTIKDTIKNAKETNKLEIAKNFISYNDALKQVQEQLIKISKNKKIIIMVDELDRCEPDYSLNVLNRLHNLFDIPNCVVLLAVNKELLNSVIENKYGENNITYLDKFFDLTFTLTSEGNQDIRLKHAELFLLEFLNEEQIKKCGLFVTIITEYLKRKPRTVIKFFEKLRFVISQFGTITEKYDYSCLVAYILLKNLDMNFFVLKNINNEKTIIDTTNEPDVLRQFFTNKLIEYLKTNKSSTYMGSKLIEKDFQINRFLIMLNLIRFKPVRNRFELITNYFGSDIDIKIEKDIEDILKILEILK